MKTIGIKISFKPKSNHGFPEEQTLLPPLFMLICL